MAGDYPSLRNFYRIVPGGMREDARAYADYHHEWNGLDAKGIPDSLLGADVVQTFNADQVNWFMQITVTVSRPCVLYVLADRRNPPPAWVQERFTDTGVDIGWEYVDPEYKIFAAKGPGKGRKLFPFGIWKLEVHEAGEVKLGPPYFERFHDARVGGRLLPRRFGLQSIGCLSLRHEKREKHHYRHGSSHASAPCQRYLLERHGTTRSVGKSPGCRMDW
jgi:hypothetical protein